MLGTAATVRTVAERLRHHAAAQVVLDPVMVATTGAKLCDARAVRAMCRELLPLATLLTPNIPETEALTGITLRRAADFDRAAEALLKLGARNVLLKGGHARGALVLDRLYGDCGHHEFAHPRQPMRAHGTGCSLAAAVAAGLALGLPLDRAVRDAGDFVARALRAGYAPGRGRVSVLAHARGRVRT
jgi:hydroxymethylpyrimidine/phosphomethylpyrimidine kinase